MCQQTPNLRRHPPFVAQTETREANRDSWKAGRG